MYVSYTVLVDKRIFAQIGAHFIFFRIILIRITNTPIKFLEPLSGTNKSLVISQKLIKFLAPLPGTNKSLVLCQKYAYQVFGAPPNFNSCLSPSKRLTQNKTKIENDMN